MMGLGCSVHYAWWRRTGDACRILCARWSHKLACWRQPSLRGVSSVITAHSCCLPSSTLRVRRSCAASVVESLREAEVLRSDSTNERPDIGEYRLAENCMNGTGQAWPDGYARSWFLTPRAALTVQIDCTNFLNCLISVLIVHTSQCTAHRD